MRNTLMLGDLICCLYEEYQEHYGDNELAALAADVALNDLLVRYEVRDSFLEREFADTSPPLALGACQ